MVGAGGPGGTLGGMPMLANATRGMGAPMAANPRFGFRPAVVQRPGIRRIRERGTSRVF